MSQMETNIIQNAVPVRIGFIPLIDCAPFVIAQEKGFFLDEGVNVELSKEASWASIRDKVTFNLLDGAHMLASMPIAASLGIGTIKTAMQTSFTVSHNGNGITIGNALYEQLQSLADSSTDIRTGVALKRLIDRRSPELAPLRFAVVYPYSSHNYQLRDWLSRAGIDSDKDVQIIVVPPVKMLDSLKLGGIDGYCVGEPWNSLAVEQGVGHMLVTGYEIWGSTPEKVFGVNSFWAEQNQATYLAIIRALEKACLWVDEANNQSELLSILSHPDYLNCTVEQLVYGFSAIKPKGQFDWPMKAYQRFSGRNINKPLPSYALWIMGQMYRWQQLGEVESLNRIAEQVYRQDLYNKALGFSEEGESRDWYLSAEEEATWLNSVATGKVCLHPDGILTGFDKSVK
ncbi:MULTISPECIES: CmpA/NrtA family ABC transporter substrate-binding protein [Marinomonas]|uniref:ABC transporter substrate-binding protein n=1 Tax=Marinomonas arctica TaxID=383750 RepID=A0A7H1JAH9_9GAMM|nr:MULTISPECIES: CmpA/NrtA family ABC transporter substrate-binding protein [Marinomonas]MCS7487725.1 nitrate transporter [Marinomonas sp. BSi20414]QNT07495.1 ABC transporter substrate-binding protein [Marinomonas arctica]GGN20323.1 nitrate transporter [Marinomonas arctica]